MICKLDKFLENLQIAQCNSQIDWPIYELANWPDWQIGRNITTQSFTIALIFVEAIGFDDVGIIIVA